MEKKIGVYICKSCSIADTVEIEKLEEVATKEKKVPVCKTHDALCSPAGIDLIKNDISGEGVNTIVVAACSPRVKYREFNFPGNIVERANIREFGPCRRLHQTRCYKGPAYGASRAVPA
jgi:quinone-modifying oxidoreductase subunit QmoB